MSDDDNIKMAKIIFMGNQEVGKTSIIRTFLEGKTQREASLTKTIQDFCRIIEVNEGGQRHKIKLTIWDAAGEGNTHNLAHLFVREVQVGVLVYSITSMQSFKDINPWIEHIADHNEDYMLFFVGNKSDLTVQRVVPESYGNQMVRDNPKAMSFRETSAYNDVESIQALFEEIGIALVRSGKFKSSRGST